MAESDGFPALRDKRLRYVESARENDFEEGLRSLLAELYPDNAHFIYELLQNAEDARATVVEFELGEDELTVTHDGAQAFSLADIESITGIGKSTKKDDETQIGKFGVGFKAVFAYTTKPEILSGDYCFAITDLFVPKAIDGAAQAGRTTFRFPFDRAEKPANVARAEVERGLRNLDEKTLLFLTSIREITYALPGGDIGFVKRVDVDELTIRVEASQGEEFVGSTWLRLVGPASTSHDGQNPLTVAAAFKLEPRQVGRSRSAAKSSVLEPSLGIVPLPAGDVSIYFPAAKETSRLKFHIHAPFASTVARDSVRDTPENAQLVANLGNLIVSHLEGFRDRGLIDDGLLATLPNTDDDLKPIYGQIRSAVIEAFNNEALTPVRGVRSHGRARSLVASPPEFRTGLDEPDLLFLLELAGTLPTDEPRWVRNFDGRAGRFVLDLDTLAFGWAGMNDALSAVCEAASADSDDDWEDDSDASQADILRRWHAWLEAKDDEKILGFYQLLGQDADSEIWTDLREIPLVRLRTNGGTKHVKGPETYLPATRGDAVKSRVPVELAYFDDDASRRSNNLRSFYSTAGVKRWDERAKIDRRLAAYRKGKYPEVDDGAPSPKHLDDMRAFVQFGHAEAFAARSLSMFTDVHFVLVLYHAGGLAWAKPSEVFLDEPFRSSGLSAVYELPLKYKYQLPGFYLEIEGISEFLEALGAVSGIEIKSTDVFNNPELKRHWWENNRHSHYTQAFDWRIEHLEKIAATGDPSLLQTLWNSVVEAKATKASAIYQANRSATRHVFDSQLRQQLTSTAWVLDREGNLRRPREMTLEELPDGWRQPSADSLVHKLGFGALAAEKERLEVVKPQYAEQLGIGLGDAEVVKEAREAGIDVETVLHELIELQRSQEAFPDGASEDPDRRASVAALDASNAAIHQTEIRPRSVVVGQGPSSQDARAYLREHYTNSAGDMYCQACQAILPFRVKGEWYFEATQFVGNRNRNHHCNALALCPLCAATYRYKRETSDDTLLEALAAATIEARQGALDLPVLLNGHVVRLRLTGKHALDLKSAMATAGEARGQA